MPLPRGETGDGWRSELFTATLFVNIIAKHFILFNLNALSPKGKLGAFSGSSLYLSFKIEHESQSLLLKLLYERKYYHPKSNIYFILFSIISCIKFIMDA